MQIRFKTYSYMLTLFLCPLLLYGCSFLPETRDYSFKQKVMNDMYLVLTPEYIAGLINTSDDSEIDSVLNEFWTNEFPDNPAEKDEYRKRLNYCNLHFPDEYGWGQSDRKRIYLTYGPPDYVDKTDWTYIAAKGFSHINSMEVWHYNRPGKNNSLPTILRENYNGEMKFVFGDITGSGHYQILDSSEDSGDIDVRVTR